MSESKINAERVQDVFLDCLFEVIPSEGKTIPAIGITQSVGFDPKKIDEYRDEINTMLDELPTEFRSEKDGGGGGWSFLNACNDKDGNQWTGFHQRMEQLFQLGIATGKAEYLMSREMWSVLPGGVPYLVIHSEPIDVELKDIKDPVTA